MLSTLKVASKLSNNQGKAILTSQICSVYKNSQYFQRCLVHEDRRTAPDIQEYEPYSNLPYYDGKKGHLVYVGNMARLVKAIKMFSLSTSLVSIGSIPLIRSAIEESITKAGVMGGISTIIFLTPLLLHFVTRKYVTDVYFNADTEVFTLATKTLFLCRKEVEFYSTDVEIPFVGGLVVNHIVKKKPYFMERELFFSKDVYIKMVGYDKPPEPYRTNSDQESSKQEEKVQPEENKDDRKMEEFGLFSRKESSNSKIKTNISTNSKGSADKRDKEKFGLFND